MLRKRKLAKLTDEEDFWWTFFFCNAIETGHRSQEQADKIAWNKIQNNFPRLKKYDAIKTAA